MTDETAPAPAPPPKPRKRFGPRRALAWAGLAVAGLVVLFAAGLVVLNTGPGRAAIAQIVSGMTQANGLQVRIGRIDGSIYSRMTVRDLELRDPKGVFASSPEVTVDWRPLALFGNYLMLREASSPLVTVARKP
jgi:translocation and assembly module TamB